MQKGIFRVVVCVLASVVSHHHEPRRPPLHLVRRAIGAEEASFLRSPEGIPLAIHSAVHLEVVISQRAPAVCASQALGVVFLLPLAF